MFGIIIVLVSALEKLREEFRADSESLAQSEAVSILSLCDNADMDMDTADGDEAIDEGECFTLKTTAVLPV